MFGVKFSGHPDLRRILMYPEFERASAAPRLPRPIAFSRSSRTARCRTPDKIAPFGVDEGMSFGPPDLRTPTDNDDDDLNWMEPIDQELDPAELELPTEPMLLNVGPAHPAMHGTVRIVMELSGESIERCDVQVGYLHRGFEKIVRARHVDAGVPLRRPAVITSRPCSTTWLSRSPARSSSASRCRSVASGIAWRSASSRACPITSRATAPWPMELGAFTPFLWMIKGREMIWDLMEEETGARLTHSFGRVGGMAQPPTEGFKPHARAVSTHILEIVEEVERLLLGNRIFLESPRERRRQ